MSLRSALEASTAHRKGPRCSVANLLDTLDDDDRQALLDAFASDLQHAQITRALKAEGHRVGDQTIARHRGGECSCR